MWTVETDDMASKNAIFDAGMSTSVVTGAGSGIGRAVALALAGRGLDVALLGRTKATLEETARAIEALGRRSLVATCDVSRADEVSEAAKAVEAAWGAPRVVVSNAGVPGRPGLVVDTTEADWDAVIDANLKGTFLVARAFLPAMIARGRGRLVAIASISATLGTPRFAPYVASKWGVVGLVKSLAEELRGTGLQALAVLPGSVDTPLLAVSGFAPQMTADQVAGLVAYAALDAPDAMNASAIEMFGP
jgi:3-oxoacyl-[acyl-carrier protein] reductase